MPGNIHIGTSGWNYDHWKEAFYPKNLSQDQWLDHYKDQFDTVEVNNSFYKLPDTRTLEKWKKNVPENFVFAAKANRYITHMKKLNEPEDSLNKMLDAFKSLGNNLEPILFQLPPNWKFNEERFRQFTDLLPDDFIYVFEFRNKDWINETSFSILEEKNSAFCIYELAGYQSPEEVTADFVYIRLHGPSNKKYRGKYNQEQLSYWADRLNTWSEQNKDVYIYFDNDEKGYAPQNALELKEMIG